MFNFIKNRTRKIVEEFEDCVRQRQELDKIKEKLKTEEEQLNKRLSSLGKYLAEKEDDMKEKHRSYMRVLERELEAKKQKARDEILEFDKIVTIGTGFVELAKIKDRNKGDNNDA